MARARLIIGTHNHLPLGRSEEAAERLYQQSLKPFLAVLYRYPGFAVTLHYSGILMEWLEEAHPEFLTLLGEMVGRGQVDDPGFVTPDAGNPAVALVCAKIVPDNNSQATNIMGFDGKTIDVAYCLTRGVLQDFNTWKEDVVFKMDVTPHIRIEGRKPLEEGSINGGSFRRSAVIAG